MISFFISTFRLIGFNRLVVFLVLFSAILYYSSSPVLAGGEVEIVVDGESYGPVNQNLGVIVPNSLSSSVVSELKSLFPQGGVYLKLVNPGSGIIASSGFQELTNAGFNWYFLFTSESQLNGSLIAYKASYEQSRLVVEIEKTGASLIPSLKSSYPNVRFHVGYLPVWPRSTVNELLTQLQPPMIEGISWWIGDINEGSVWSDVTFAFDTMFDASKAIAGEKVIFPANTILSISDSQYPSYTDIRKSSYLSGLMSGALITTVQSQNRGGEAPIRYMNPGLYTQFSPAEKQLLSHFSRFMALKPQIVWPYAIANNGDIWSNGIFDRSNTEPIVGVIGKLSDGNYYGFLTNTDSTETTITINTLPLASLSYDSTVRDIAYSSFSNNILVMGPYETVVLYPRDINIPTVPVTPPDGTTATNPPDLSCISQQKTGDYTCDGAVNESDFSTWLSDFDLKRTTLQYFEYWRRAFY